MVVGEDEKFRDVTAITSYGVVATLEGHSRSYLAAFLWLSESRRQRASFIVSDHISQGVDYVTAETLPAPGEEPIEFMTRESSIPQKVVGGCDYERILDSKSDAEIGYDGHISGAHFGSASFSSTCICSTACQSTCTATIAASECSDSGVTDWCHKMAVGSDSSAASVMDGNVQGAQCAAGFGCAKKACAFCLCGLSVTVAALGAEVTVGFGDDPDWIFRYTYSQTCQKCTVQEPDEDPDDSGSSPLVFDLDRKGFQFTDLEGGVRFDLDADGMMEAVSWTQQDSGDAFLVLDRNSNGLIDNGTELFGDITEQPSTTEPNGYLALAVFDELEQGGNADGWITTEDSVFHSLRLWTDSNHDGVSQPTELVTLAFAGIGSIDLAYHENRRRDSHGNLLRFNSKAYYRDDRHCNTTDVFFLRG